MRRRNCMSEKSKAIEELIKVLNQKKKIIRKQSILLFVSLSIAYLICSQLISMEIRKRFAVQGILSKSLGMGYLLEINNIMDGNIKLVHSSSKYNTSMGKVSKIIEIENRYIGYLEEDGEIGDNHYFYISGISAEFELTEEEAKKNWKGNYQGKIY